MKLFKSDWQFWTVILVLAVSLPIHIAIRYYFWDLSAENFDHVMSPLGAIVSALLFIVAIWQTNKQNAINQRQHQIIESKNAKENLQIEFEAVELALKETFETHVIAAVGIPSSGVLEEKYKVLTINSLNYIPFLREEIRTMFEISDYIKDHSDSLNGDYFQHSHYRKKEYRRCLNAIIRVGSMVDFKYNQIRHLLRQVEQSSMTEEDRIAFRRRMEIGWLKQYFEFIEFETHFTIPELRNTSSLDPVLWKDYVETKIGNFNREFGELFK